MAQAQITESQAREVLKAVEKHKSQSAAADSLGLPRTTFQNRLRAAKAGRFVKGVEFVAQPVADTDMDVQELIAFRKRQFEIRQAAEEKNKLIPVTVRKTGPIGILWFGDPHVDDDGCNLPLLDSHVELVRVTDGLFGATVGDISNNWVGRLARLYSEQGTSAKQAWKLTEWFIRSVNWLLLIGGNHDCWSGAGDPIQWMTREIDGIHKNHGARIALNFPNQTGITINARHNFPGNSMYNPAHGGMKNIHFGVRDHLLVGGHKHISGYGVLKDPATGKTCHALQIASYKVYDRYAEELSLRDQALSPSAVTVIDPSKPDDHPDKIKIFWDAFEGADYLTYLRRKAA